MNTVKTILIVDDEEDLRSVTAEALKIDGFNVLTAADGETGLAEALRTKPDLILLDVVMPVLGGLEMLKKLREDAWGKNANVIILSAHDDIKSVGGAYDYQISNYIIKADSSLSEIVAKVHEVLKSTI